MSIGLTGQPMTPNQFAKRIVWEHGAGSDYWAERHPEDYRRMTQREVDAVEAAIERQSARVAKLLGF